MYRGPFVYRKSSGSSSLTLESVAFRGGRLAAGKALLHVRDYLGSVRAVSTEAREQHTRRRTTLHSEMSPQRLRCRPLLFRQA